MTPTQKPQWEDFAKKRREYMRRKAQANVHAFIGAVGTVGFTGLGSFLLFDLFFLLGFAPRFAAGVIIVVGITLLAAVSGLGWIALAFLRTSAEAAKAIPYVPPVSEQIAALAAEEVLLRASEQPNSSPAELLRATKQSAGVVPGEMLRAQIGGTRNE